MKTRFLSIALLAAMLAVSCKKESAKEQESTLQDDVSVESTEVSQDMAMTELSFGVRGNCGMCKETIEKAANGVEGVVMATWDKTQKNIDVEFDESKTDAMAIHKAIAASGYDTDKVEADEEAYNSLPECCQYDQSMMMNQDVPMMEDEEHHHDMQ